MAINPQLSLFPANPPLNRCSLFKVAPIASKHHVLCQLSKTHQTHSRYYYQLFAEISSLVPVFVVGSSMGLSEVTTIQKTRQVDNQAVGVSAFFNPLKNGKNEG